MSFLENIKNEIDQAHDHYSLMSDKIMLFESVIYNDYIIKQKESYLDSYMYDENYYLTESNDNKSFVEKTKMAINKIIEKLKDFLNTCKEKMIEIFTKIKESNLIKKFESLIKVNPKVGNIKVDVEDNSSKRNFIQKTFDEAQKHLAKIKSGKISDDDVEEIEKRKNKVVVKVAAGAAVVSMSVAAIMIALKQIKSKAEDSTTVKLLPPGDIGKIHGRQNTATPPDVIYASDRNVQDAAIYNSIVNGYNETAYYQSELCKSFLEQLSNYTEALHRAASDAKELALTTSSKTSGKKQLPVIELSSTREYGFDTDDYFSELCNDIFGDDSSTDDDFNTMYEELCNDIFF